MAAYLYLLATVCVGVLINQAFGQRQCTTESWGDTKSKQITLPKTYLGPGYVEWQIRIPVPKNCRHMTGGTVSVCDTDVTPTVKYLNQRLVYVHRNGKYNETAEVYATVYCTTYYQKDAAEKTSKSAQLQIYPV